MINNILRLENLYLSLLKCKLDFNEYIKIGEHKGKTVVVFKDDVIKGLWIPKTLD